MSGAVEIPTYGKTPEEKSNLIGSNHENKTKKKAFAEIDFGDEEKKKEEKIE